MGCSAHPCRLWIVCVWDCTWSRNMIFSRSAWWCPTARRQCNDWLGPWGTATTPVTFCSFKPPHCVDGMRGRRSWRAMHRLGESSCKTPPKVIPRCRVCWKHFRSCQSRTPRSKHGARRVRRHPSGHWHHHICNVLLCGSLLFCSSSMVHGFSGMNGWFANDSATNYMAFLV